MLGASILSATGEVGTSMRFRRRISIAAATAAAGLLAVLPATPAIAVGPGQAVANNELYAKHEQGGLGGNIGARLRNGSYVQMSVNSMRYGNENDPLVVRYINAGSGYCVWEQVYMITPSWGEPEKVGERTHGKGLASAYRQTLGWETAPLTSRAVFSDLKVFRC